MAAPVLNTAICTLEDLAPVIQAQNEFNSFVYNTIINGSVTDTYKVLVSGADPDPPDYLWAKINDHGAFNPDYDITVSTEDVGTAVKLYWSASSIAGFSGTGTLFLTLDDGVLQFSSFTDTVDNFTVKITAGDTTASYLHNAFDLNATYAGGADILVATATVGSAATNQTEQLFVDVSAISGYNASGDFFLGMHNNAVSWMAFSDIVSGGISVGYALDVSGATVSFDPTEITGFTSEFQFFMHLASASAATDPAWKSVTGYDATKKQIQWHQSGSFSFNTVTNYDTTTAQHLSHINGTWQFLGALRFAITTAAIPAATGNYNGAITPGTTVGNNIQLYDFGATYGASAAQAGAAQAENYMRAAVEIHKPIFVFERAPGIWVVPAEGCTAVPAS